MGNEKDGYFNELTIGILNRIFGVYPIGLSSAVLYTKANGFLYGNAMPNIIGLFPDSVNISKWIHYYIFSFDGDAPPPAIGYSYVNFGYIGLFINSLVIALTSYILLSLINILSNKILKVLLLITFMTALINLSMSSLFDTILDPRQYVLSIFLIFLYNLKSVR